MEVTWYLVITTGKAEEVDGGDEGQRGAASGGTVLPLSAPNSAPTPEEHSYEPMAGTAQAS